MNYSVRNPCYLRISKNTVLPIYVYLDERHVHWMSDTILQHVLSDLRPNILPKLKAEVGALSSAATQKKATVDTHRGDSYQFCYFFRKTEPHAVLIKSRNFTVAPLQKAILKPSQSKTKQTKRKGTARESPVPPARSKRRRITRQPSFNGEDAELPDTIANAPADDDDDSDEYNPDVEMETIGRETDDIVELEIANQEEKPKPILGLTYQGFNIYGQCLCIVVEPWPIVRSMTIVPSATPQLMTQPTLQINPFPSSKTPLFLPEEPEVEECPRLGEENRSHVNQAYLKKVLDQDELASDNEDNLGGMMEFSQVLYNIGDSRAGAINDDDDMDGAILFGDADEVKEL
ncbi:hypothetical protein HYPSUDRAFT_266538 [Hypholoma sublateritium FD-334 SS-4]|uniref:Uncharacterized protein n=1 Tax=Hypholoma sublateritium (strain FD-334 SS-4) TaxID=945553 RepID=A0A0D2QF26_HYPSF|nr:hypothetical protein HYPSUDRAFT_266538 [Hypholoma sublateritium FD-334 SS-4]